MRFVQPWQYCVSMFPLVIGGCLIHQPTRVGDVSPRETVRATSDSSFVFVAKAFHGAERVPSCRLESIDGRVSKMRADTVWLDQIAAVAPAAGEPRACRNVSAGFFTRSSHTSVRAVAAYDEPRPLQLPVDEPRPAKLPAIVKAVLAFLVWWWMSSHDVQDGQSPESQSISDPIA